MYRTLEANNKYLANTVTQEMDSEDLQKTPSESVNQPTVLIVDDDPQVRESLRLLMQSIDMHVETFSSGDDFLANYRAHDRDCLVVDVHMPGISGIELLERLDKDHFEIPTIVISGYRDPQVEQRARELGVLEFVKKPFDPKHLLSLIQDVFSVAD